MIRGVELLVFLLPVLGFVLWRVAAARGLAGPPSWQLWLFLLVLLLMAGLLYGLAARERLPPGRYVPAQSVGGRIVPGHSEPGHSE